VDVCRVAAMITDTGPTARGISLSVSAVGVNDGAGRTFLFVLAAFAPAIRRFVRPDTASDRRRSYAGNPRGAPAALGGEPSPHRI
jgi:hypothetical protein